jgi:hypothetical protein
VVNPRELLLAFEQPLLRDRNDQEAIDRLVEPRQLRDVHDLPQHVVGREARILRAIDEEAEKAFDVRRRARTGGNDDRGAFVAVRKRVLWQTAQLLATRGKPITFFVNPTGSSWPCSHGTPSDA